MVARAVIQGPQGLLDHGSVLSVHSGPSDAYPSHSKPSQILLQDLGVMKFEQLASTLWGFSHRANSPYPPPHSYLTLVARGAPRFHYSHLRSATEHTQASLIGFVPDPAESGLLSPDAASNLIFDFHRATFCVGM